MQIEDLLADLTYDSWTVEFVSRGRSGETKQPVLLDLPRLAAQCQGKPVVCLFSGGLDALAGIAALLSPNLSPAGEPRFGIAGPLYLISVETNPSIAATQRLLVQGLRYLWSSVDVRHVSLPAELQSRSYSAKDSASARTRGLLFLAVGIVAALLGSASALHLYENGIGAINLPYHRGQVGADKSRSAHPTALLAVQELARNALGADDSFVVSNPFLFQTKAEMCVALERAGIESLVPHTLSCDRGPKRESGPQHCGVCTSCLLRRLSLIAAGLGALDSQTRYRLDVLRGDAGLATAPFQMTFMDDVEHLPRAGRPSVASTSRSYLDHALTPIRAMAQQAADLSVCLSDPGGHEDAWDSLVRAFPWLETVVWQLGHDLNISVFETQSRLLRLYRRYVDEWRQFADLLPSSVLGGLPASTESD